MNWVDHSFFCNTSNNFRFVSKFQLFVWICYLQYSLAVMSSSESENGDYFDECGDFDFESEGIQPFMYQPMYTEEELEKRLRDCENACEDSETSALEERGKPCVYNKCVDMNVEAETLCSIHSLPEHSNIYYGADCIAETPGFTLVCLEKDVLETSLGAWENWLVKKGRSVTRRIVSMAYKQYIWWIYGKVGRDVRIPTCVLY